MPAHQHSPSDDEPREDADDDSGESLAIDLARSVPSTRRGFLIGGAAATVAVSSGALASEADRWTWSKSADGDGRSTYSFAYAGVTVAAFPERAFGAQARIHLKPIPNRKGRVNDDGRIDLLARIIGASILPEIPGAARHFNLDFSFFHAMRNGANEPSIDMNAHGWIFGNDGACVASDITRQAWANSASAPIAIRSHRKDLASAFCQAVFEDLLSLPKRATVELAFSPAKDESVPFEWRIRTSNADRAGPDKFIALDILGSARRPMTGGRLPDTVLARGAQVRIWREAEEQVRKKADEGGGDSKSPSRPEHDIFDGKQVGGVTRASFVAPVNAGETVTLADHSVQGADPGTFFRPVLVDYELSTQQPPDFARWAAPDGSEIVAARATASGEFGLVTIRSGALTPIVEGKIPVANGEIRLFKKCGEPGVKLDCRLGIDEDRSFSLVTAFGVFSARSPEERKPDPGAPSVRAPIRVRANGWNSIERFEATVLAHDSSVSLPASALPSGNLGAQGHFARLDFLGGAHISLRLHTLRDTKSVPAAGGRIMLGFSSAAPSAPDFSGPPCIIPMETARLRIVRYRDLVDLTYRFAGLDLVNDSKACLLRPRNRATPTTGGLAGHTIAHDPRPIIVVEFPPQHRAEQAFFHRRVARPVPPRLPDWHSSAKQALKQLNFLRRAYTKKNAEAPALAVKRVEARKAVLRGLLAVADRDGETERVAELRELLKPVPAKEDASVKVLPLPASAADQQKIQAKAFIQFAEMFYKKSNDLPREQRLYIGQEFLDPDALLVAERVASRPVKGEKAGAAEAEEGADATNPLLDAVPADPVSEGEQQAIRERSKDSRAVEEAIASLRKQRDPSYPAFVNRYNDIFKDADLRKELDNFEVPKTGIMPFVGRDWLRSALLDLKRQSEAYEKSKPEDRPKGREPSKAHFEAFVQGFKKKLNVETPDKEKAPVGDPLTNEVASTPVQSRLSGRTRLAFRVNTNDFETGGKGGEIPFTVDDLTNFSRFDLAVVRRAQKAFKSYEDGGLRPEWDAEESKDFQDMLVHQGFSRGGHGKLDQSTSNNEDPKWVEQTTSPTWSEARVTVDQRLAEVVSSTAVPPSPYETAIEMPFRLILSPSQDALFRTPRPVPPELFCIRPDEKSGVQSDASELTASLWTAEFDARKKALMRAIWSPDFRPEAFLPPEPRHPKKFERFLSSFFPVKKSRSNRTPLRGPYAPWAMGRHVSSANLKAAAEDVEGHRFRTSLDAFDRHELVALSSVHGLPVLGRVSLDGKRIGVDQLEPPPGFQVALRGSSADIERLEHSDIYVPKPINQKGFELALSSLGGYLNVNASFEPPAAVVDGDGRSLYDALSIERWSHRIVLGRDISAEVVYKGYLMPFGIRAALIKSTERRFEAVCGHHGPVAILRQRMFIHIDQPTKEYGAFRQPDDGRRVPFKVVRIATTTTPDIVDPFDLAGPPDDTEVWPSGLVDLTARSDGARPVAPPGTPFWPRTARRPGAEVMFQVLLDEKVTVMMPLLFVDNITVHNEESLRNLCDYYNRHGKLPPVPAADAAARKPAPVAPPAPDPYMQRSALVERPLYAQKLTFAASLEEGDTQFETDLITFAVEGYRQGQPTGDGGDYIPMSTNTEFASDAFLHGADQPPFYPAMRRAGIRLGQVDRLTGRTGDTVVVGYDSIYAWRGFVEDVDGEKPKEGAAGKEDEGPQRDIFLAVAQERTVPLRLGNEGQRSGGIARPEIDIVGLSRSRGPIGSSSANAKLGLATKPGEKTPSPAPVPPEVKPVGKMIGRSDVKDFFGPDAKLLGLVSLKELVSQLADKKLEPRLREITEFGGGLANDADTFIRDNVLRPLKAALAAFKERVNRMKFAGQTGDDALKQIFPDLDTSLRGFEKKLDEALAAPPPAKGLDRSIEAYSGVHTAGRGLVRALERAARDPATHIREVLRKHVDDFVGLLRTSIEREWHAMAGSLSIENVRETAKEALRGALRARPGITTLIIPLPVSEEVLASAHATAVEAVILAAHSAAFEDDSSWDTPADQPLFDFRKFRDAFGARLDDGLARLKLSEALLKKLTEELKPERDFDALEAPLRELFSSLIRAFVGTSKRNAPIADAIKDARDNFGKIGEAMKEATARAVSGRLLGQQCNDVVTAFDAFCRTVLPITALTTAPEDSVQHCLEPNFNWKQCQAPKAPVVYRAVGALTRLKIGIQTLDSEEFKKNLAQAGQDSNISTDAELLERLLQAIAQRKANIAAPIDAVAAAVKSMDRLARTYDQTLKRIKAVQPLNCVALPSELPVIVGYWNELNRRRIQAVRDLSVLWEELPALVGAISVTIGNSSIARSLDNDPEDVEVWLRNSTPDSLPDYVEVAQRHVLSLLVEAFSAVADLLAEFTSLGAFDKDRREPEKSALLTVLQGLHKILQRDRLAAKLGEHIDALARNDNTNESRLSITTATALRFDLEKLNSVGKRTIKELVGQVITGRDVELIRSNLRAHDIFKEISGAPLRPDKPVGLAFERGLQQGILGLVANVNAAYDGALVELAPKMSNAVRRIANGYAAAIKQRNELLKVFSPKDGATPSVFARVGELAVRQLLSVCPTEEKPADKGPAADNPAFEDLLTRQEKWLRDAAPKLERGSQLEQRQTASDLLEMVGDWHKHADAATTKCFEKPHEGPNALLQLSRQVSNAIDDIARRDFARIVDMDLLRKAIEDQLRQLIPTRLTLAYDFAVELKKAAAADIFIPDHPDTREKFKHLFTGDPTPCKLKITTRATTDLLRPSKPKTTVDGSLGPFAIKLIGSTFDVVTLKFSGAKYGNETGGKFKSDISDVKLGKMVEFLDQLSQYISFGSNGFFLAARYDLPGIEAGYRMAPIYLTLGALNISNLSLNASCVLPFGPGGALFKVGLSRPEAPFSITVGIYGGAGHLALYANADGIVGFTTSMEFGAIADYRLGPVTGAGRVTAGVYIRSILIDKKRVATVEGVFTAAGSGNIGMFRFSAMLQVRVIQQASGGMAGHAVFVFSFSLGVKDIEFRFVIFKTEKKGFAGGGMSNSSGGGGGGAQGRSLNGPVRYADARDAGVVADATPLTEEEYWDKLSAPARGGPTIQPDTVCKGANFEAYMDYFSEVEPWQPL